MGALGGAACETAVVVILTDEFKDNLATAIVSSLAFREISRTLGPTTSTSSELKDGTVG